MSPTLKDVSAWSLDRYALGGLYDWSSIVLLKVTRGPTHVGYVFVIDKKFGDTAKYKMPGGHKKDGETPYDTAMREALGEAGITVTNLMLVDQWKEGRDEKQHWKFLFVGEVSESRSMALNAQDSENEGEEPEFFTIEEFKRLVTEKKFLPAHYRELEFCKLIEPISTAA